MTRREIERQLIELAAKQAGVAADEITPATHFVNDLEFDSLDTMEYAMEVEDELGVTIADDEVEKLQTVEHVIDYVVKQLTPAEA